MAINESKKQKMHNDKITQQLGNERISKLLWHYALPSIIAMSAASMYNIIDSIFIGHGVGALAIAALAIALPLMNLSAAFGAMAGIGASSLISIKMGQRDFRSAKQIVGNMVMINIITGVGFAAICLLFLDPILYLFGSSEDTIGYTRDFMQIILAGNVITHIYFGLNRTIQATGFPRKSMVIMLVSIAGNLILCPIFIFWLDMGVKGAAWATVISQAVALALEIAHFLNPKHEIKFERWAFKLRKRAVSGILSIGMAPFLMNITASVVVVFINNALQSNGGDLHIGAYGIVNRIALLFLMVVFGFNQGMQPIVGYNFGARNYDRVKETLTKGIVVAMSITTLGFLVCQLFPRTIAMMFTTDESLIAVSEEGLRIAMSMFIVVGFQAVVSSFFQSIGNAKSAIFISLTRQLIFLLPLLIILPPIFGSKGVWISMPISDAASALIALVMLMSHYKKLRKTT